MRVPLHGAVLVGALSPAQSRAPFETADVIVRAGESLVRARKYDVDHIEGPDLTAEDLDRLLHADEMIRLPDVRAARGAAAWIIRGTGPGLRQLEQDLRMSAGHIFGPHHVSEGIRCFVVRLPEARAAQDAAANAALQGARRLVMRRDATSVAAAELAFALAAEKSAELYGLVSAAHVVTGDDRRGEAFLAVASRLGFGESARRCRDELVVSRDPSAVRRTTMREAALGVRTAGEKLLPRPPRAA